MPMIEARGSCKESTVGPYLTLLRGSDFTSCSEEPYNDVLSGNRSLV